MKAEIVTKEKCKWCVLAKKLMKKREIEFSERVLHQDITREQLIELLPNVRTVPQIWVEGHHVGGYDQFSALCEQFPENDQLLEHVETREAVKLYETFDKNFKENQK